MKIVLYDDHHHLPFWHGTTTAPASLFDEEKMKSYKGLREEVKSVSVEQSCMWPVLIGLKKNRYSRSYGPRFLYS